MSPRPDPGSPDMRRPIRLVGIAAAGCGSPAWPVMAHQGEGMLAKAG